MCVHHTYRVLGAVGDTALRKTALLEGVLGHVAVVRTEVKATACEIQSVHPLPPSSNSAALQAGTMATTWSLPS